MFKFLPNPAALLGALKAISPRTILPAAKVWLLTSGIWYAASLAGHVVVLAGLLFVVSRATRPDPEGEAPAFESAVDTEIPQPELDHFEVGETPLEPTELNTETLSLVDAPAIEAEAPAIPDAADALGGAGGGASATGGIGGLDGLAVKALGPGPLVRGAGVGAGGSGRGPGSGGDGSGFGARGDGASRKAMVGGYGGTKASERAVAAALNWLARHQNPDGSWSLNGFAQRCKGDPCTEGGNVNSDMAATAMGLLPFLAAGQTHQSRGPYQRTIAGGLNWMINHMKRDGDLRDGSNMYAHGLAAITLCEAYGLSKDSRIGLAAQNAIRFIEKSQIPSTGGWHYAPYPTQTLGDTSVVGWQLMALKSAQMAGLECSPGVFDGAKKWLGKVAKTPTGGLFAYNFETPATPSMTSVGLLCTQYLGTKRDAPAIKEGMGYLMKHLPNLNTRDTYYWYYATQVMHNVPGPEWDAWNRQMRRILIDTQIKEGCAAGSWNPVDPTPERWREAGGRVMITSLSALTLEVYYRYLPLYKIDDNEKTEPAEGETAQAKK